MEILHNDNITELDGLNSEQLKNFYNKNPWRYYQNYVAGSISPYYDAKLACIGAAEEFCELKLATDKADIISEAGDFLFQLTNIANFYGINLENLNAILYDCTYLTMDNMQAIDKAFGSVLSAVMKMSRYPDYQEVFQKKWGMTAKEKLKLELDKTIHALSGFVALVCNMSLKEIMNYNLQKLDERHSADGNYQFGSGFRNTLSNGGTVNR